LDGFDIGATRGCLANRSPGTTARAFRFSLCPDGRVFAGNESSNLSSALTACVKQFIAMLRALLCSVLFLTASEVLDDDVDCLLLGEAVDRLVVAGDPEFTLQVKPHHQVSAN